MLAMLNIAMEGLAWAGLAGVGTGGELDNINQVNVLLLPAPFRVSLPVVVILTRNQVDVVTWRNYAGMV